MTQPPFYARTYSGKVRHIIDPDNDRAVLCSSRHRADVRDVADYESELFLNPEVWDLKPCARCESLAAYSGMTPPPARPSAAPITPPDETAFITVATSSGKVHHTEADSAEMIPLCRDGRGARQGTVWTPTAAPLSCSHCIGYREGRERARQNQATQEPTTDAVAEAPVIPATPSLSEDEFVTVATDNGKVHHATATDSRMIPVCRDDRGPRQVARWHRVNRPLSCSHCLGYAQKRAERRANAKPTTWSDGDIALAPSPGPAVPGPTQRARILHIDGDIATVEAIGGRYSGSSWPTDVHKLTAEETPAEGQGTDRDPETAVIGYEPETGWTINGHPFADLRDAARYLDATSGYVGDAPVDDLLHAQMDALAADLPDGVTLAGAPNTGYTYVCTVAGCGAAPVLGTFDWPASAHRSAEAHYLRTHTMGVFTLPLGSIGWHLTDTSTDTAFSELLAAHRSIAQPGRWRTGRVCASPLTPSGFCSQPVRHEGDHADLRAIVPDDDRPALPCRTEQRKGDAIGQASAKLRNG